MEFDILDKSRSKPGDSWFLDTPSRAKLLAGLPVESVHVLWMGTLSRTIHLADFIRPSSFISPNHAESLRAACLKSNQDFERVQSETDMTGLMEGLYIKVEEDSRVIERYKLVRDSFVNKIIEGDEHHLNRQVFPNQLREGVHIFSQTQ